MFQHKAMQFVHLLYILVVGRFCRMIAGAMLRATLFHPSSEFYPMFKTYAHFIQKW